MTSVREATFDLFRAHGMTTIFGNPGSTELPMLADFPEDFTYVLGLQELVVVGMADGYAQASGRPTHVNLHTAPGVGNAVGGIFNAQANKSPLVITAGQQVRPQITIEANLTNRDATVGPQPYVKWSHEPPAGPGRPRRDRARDPPRHAAAQGPGVRVDPDGRLERRGRRGSQRRRHRAARDRPHGSRRGRSQRSRRAPGRRRSTRCWSPAPTSTPPAAGTPPSRWPRSSACRSGPAPATGGSRLGFPERHPNFAGVLPPAIGARLRDARRATTWCSSSARRCSPTTPTFPARCWARDDAAGGDHQRSRRGRPGADGRRHRRRCRARARAAGRARARGRPATRPRHGPSRAIRRPPTRPIA